MTMNRTTFSNIRILPALNSFVCVDTYINTRSVNHHVSDKFSFSQNAAVIFVLSVRLSACMAATGRIYLKSDICRGSYENLSRKLICLKSDNNIG